MNSRPLLAALLSATVACAAAGRPGESSSYLMVDVMEAASGARPTTFGGTLASDVLTFVNRNINGAQVRVPMVFEDLGQATFRLAMKNANIGPHATNFVTLTRYRVSYRRTDGRNVPGVDVPFGFDGAFTLTIADTPSRAAFTIVRIQAKEESPLRALVANGGAIAISTIADLTFYGKDQAGRDVIVTASISINFADWGDPE